MAEMSEEQLLAELQRVCTTAQQPVAPEARVTGVSPAVRTALTEATTMIAHLKFRLTEMSQSRHNHVEKAWKLEQQLAELQGKWNDAAACEARAKELREEKKA